MKTLVFVLFIWAFSQFTHAKSSFVVEEFASPESIIGNGEGIFVSNVGEKLEPTAKDGDGFISLLSKEGEMVERHFLPGKEGNKLNAPKGMVIIEGKLYVSDIDRIVGFDLTNRTQFMEIDLKEQGARFLNDLAAKDSETLWVADTATETIFEIRLQNEVQASVIRLDVSQAMAGPNGLYYDANEDRLFVVGTSEQGGRIGVITFTENKPTYQVLCDETGNFDGVSLINEYALLVSDWGNEDHEARLLIYDLDKKSVENLVLAQTVIQSLVSPADFYYDKTSNRLWIPLMKSGQVLIYQTTWQ